MRFKGLIGHFCRVKFFLTENYLNDKDVFCSKTMLIWVITDQEIRRRIANYDQIVIDTRNNKTGIFKNTLGLFYVLQYCLPFKLRLQKKNS